MTRALKVDFLGGEAEQRARRTTAIIAVIFSVLVGLLSAVGAGASYRAAAHGTDLFTEVGNLPLISDIRKLAWGESEHPAVKTEDNRLTFLIMGVGGSGHSGPELTDTILIATADLKTKRVGILSIPRDLAFPLGSGRFIKINSVNAYAEQSHPGEGARETADAFEELLGIRIDHVVKVDFDAFVDFIDALGGIDIDVERSFVDYEYPTWDDKWQTVSFEKGIQHMDGDRALKYSRSRHGSNGEGSDFARSRRQQLVMLAVREKLLSMGTLANPNRMIKLYESVSTNIQTDLTPWNILKIAPLAKEFNSEHIHMHVLTNDPKEGELVSSNVNGAFMLFPKDHDWSEIRSIAQNPFGTTLQETQISEPPKDVRVEIRNGTAITGFASLMSDYLTNEHYLVTGIGNAATRENEKTVIYDLTEGKRPNELARLKLLLDANISPTLPSWATRESASTSTEQRPEDADHTDFLIVLGTNSKKLID